MCHLSIELDQSIHPVAPVLDAVEDSGFYLRSIRVVPSSRSRRADIYLSLGGGSKVDLDALVANVRRLPGVLSTQNTNPPI
jgi:(p)ppGpp synthase/HD superfamily hydrolase